MSSMCAIRAVKAAKSALLFACAMAIGVGHQAFAARPGVTTEGTTTAFTPSTAVTPGERIDYANATPPPLLLNRTYTVARAKSDLVRALTAPTLFLGPAGGEQGSVGTGVQTPVILAPALKEISNDGPAPRDYGTSGLPFSTERADLTSLKLTSYYPYSAVGKLFFLEGATSFVCSAALIKRGIIVTAAHCAAKFGTNTFYKGWKFVPGYSNGAAPYGTWTIVQARVLTSYLNGSDSCSQYGITCQDDVAVMVLNPQNGRYAGTSTGYLGYAYGGLGFKSGMTHVTQLGYPENLDRGVYMERNDAQGAVSLGHAHNTIIGSLMTGGSSGGPWVVNFGQAPVLNGTSFGGYASYNMVVGVTSWGSTTDSVKNMGASPFTSANIHALLSKACSLYPTACS
jgi:V8-like Glu-specific endopeptidase